MLFSTGGAAVKATALSGWQVASFRAGVAATALLILVPATRRRWDLSTVVVGIAYAAGMILFILANKNTTAANAIFLQAASPLYLLVLAPLLLKERIVAADLWAMAVIAVGLALVLSGSSRATTLSPNPVLGNTLAIFSGLAISLSTLGLRWLGTKDDAEGRQSAVLVAGNVIAFAVCLPMALPVHDAAMTDWMLVGYLGVFQIGLAYLFVTRGLRGVPVVEASVLMLVEPAFNPLWVWLIHGEAPGVLPIIGGIVILSASVMRTLIHLPADGPGNHKQ